MRLACQEQLIPGDDLIQKWEFISAAGFEGIELQGFDDFRFRARRDELNSARKAGVVLPSVCGISDHFIGDFDDARRRDAIENMKSLLSVIGEVGGQGAINPRRGHSSHDACRRSSRRAPSPKTVRFCLRA